MPTGYDKDVLAWANEQARLIRTGQFDKLDVEHSVGAYRFMPTDPIR